MTQRYCDNCKGRFFLDDENDLTGIERDGKYYCSFCMENSFICELCDIMFFGTYKTKRHKEVCPKCRQNYVAYTTLWAKRRFMVLLRDSFTCQYCGRGKRNTKNLILECDHIHPRSKGGEDTMDNLITACKECNQGKIDVLLERHIVDMLKRSRRKI